MKTKNTKAIEKTDLMKLFKCRICKNKHYEIMASEKDVSICTWCSGDEE